MNAPTNKNFVVALRSFHGGQLTTTNPKNKTKQQKEVNIELNSRIDENGIEFGNLSTRMYSMSPTANCDQVSLLYSVIIRFGRPKTVYILFFI